MNSTYREILVSLEDFNRSCLSRFEDIPVIDCSICYQTQRCLAEPLPEYHILVHCRRLQLCLRAEVKYLQGSRLCLERNDLLAPVHDGTISFDWSPNDIIALLEVYDDHFGLRGFILLLSYTNEGVGFEGLGSLLAIFRRM
jgi:hypothetical protein